MKTAIASIIGALTLISFIYGGLVALDSRYTSAADGKATSRRLDYKIANDQLMGMQQRKWQLEEKYPDTTKAPMETQRQLKELDVGLELQKGKVMKMEEGRLSP